jgi:hypothetical protein
MLPPLLLTLAYTGDYKLIRKTSLEVAHFPLNLGSQFISRVELGYVNDRQYLLRYSLPQSTRQEFLYRRSSQRCKLGNVSL